MCAVSIVLVLVRGVLGGDDETMVFLHLTIWKEDKNKGNQGLQEEVEESSTKSFFIF